MTSEMTIRARAVEGDTSDRHLALVGADGIIRAVNAAWDDFAGENDGVATSVGLGVDYLDVCSRATGPDGGDGHRVALAIRAALAGDTERIAAVYPCHGPDERRWFEVQVSSVAEGDGALVTHVPVTEEELLAQMRDTITVLGGTLPRARVLEQLTRQLDADSSVLRVGLPRLGALQDALDRAPRRAPFDPDALVHAATATLPQTPDVVVEGPADTPQGDARNLALLLSELLRNVAQHAHGRATVRFTAGAEGGMQMLLDDDGPGVPLDERELVMKPQPGPEQLGIGLPIARALAHHLGGWLLVEESPAGGCRVRVEL